MYMDLIKDDFPQIYEKINSQAENAMAGNTLKIDVHKQLDIPEELKPTMQLKACREMKTTVIEGRFSVEYETKESLDTPAETMVALNRIFRMMYLPDGIEIRADLVEETSNCYFVLYYKESIDEYLKENDILKKFFFIINFMLLAMNNARL